jgi:alkanesulfonate monooxygenase SsuD/methylene tetrahydromethanopterin reductase-like flavin-dependent oxidoreductase (luciferase family)
MIGGSGEKKTLRLVAQYADSCNVFGDPELVAHKIEVLRGHCDTLGRDIREIEVTAFLPARPDWTADAILRSAEAFASIGVATVMTSTMGPDPAALLDSLFGPVVPRLAAIQSRPL